MQYRDMPRADTVAKRILSELKKKYPRLDTYLVYSSPFGQMNIGAVAKDVLREFPAMFLDGERKARALRILGERKELEAEKKDYKDVDAKLDVAAAELDVDGDVEVALRFGELSYDLVWQLQQDELVDRQRTPQTRASIEIVIGSLADLLRRT